MKRKYGFELEFYLSEVLDILDKAYWISTDRPFTNHVIKNCIKDLESAERIVTRSNGYGVIYGDELSD